MAEQQWNIMTGPQGNIVATNGVAPVPRSRHSSKQSSASSNLLISMRSPTRISIANVLKTREREIEASTDSRLANTILKSESLYRQKEQMQANNVELFKYMQYRKKLEAQIKELEEENSRLRANRHQGEAPETPVYNPRDHKKQKLINRLHEQIVNSQQKYDETSEDINKITARTKEVHNDTQQLLEKARFLTDERKAQDDKAQKYREKIPQKEREEQYLKDAIADNEKQFREEYARLLKQLADKKPVVVPDRIERADFEAPDIDDLKEQMRRIREQIQNMANNLQMQKELESLKENKDKLQKCVDSMLKQTALLDKQLAMLTEDSIEVRRHAAAKRAEVDTLQRSYAQEQSEHDRKMEYLNNLYRELYEQYHKLQKDIAEQRKKTTEHQSIKAELEYMRKLLNMKGSRLSLASIGTTTTVSTKPGAGGGGHIIIDPHHGHERPPSTTASTVMEDNVDIDFRKIGGTIHPHSPFEPQKDAVTLYKAMKGMGTNEKMLNKVLGNRSLKQRREVFRTFNKLYEPKGERLDRMIIGDTSGHYQTALLTLLDNFGTMDARSVNKSIQSRDIIQIVMTLGTRTHQQIAQMQTAYQKEYQRVLVNDLGKEFSDPILLRFLRHLLSGQRTVSGQTIYKTDAEKEYAVLNQNNGPTWDTPAVMEQILPVITSRSFEYIYYLTKVLWKETHPHMDICEYVSVSLVDSNYKVALKTYLSLVTILPAQCFARQIHHAIVDKNKAALTYYVISRSELDTIDIKKVYHQTYGTKLEDHIRKKLGNGDYEQLLQEVLTVNRLPESVFRSSQSSLPLTSDV